MPYTLLTRIRASTDRAKPLAGMSNAELAASLRRLVAAKKQKYSILSDLLEESAWRLEKINSP